MEAPPKKICRRRESRFLDNSVTPTLTAMSVCSKAVKPEDSTGLNHEVTCSECLATMYYSEVETFEEFSWHRIGDS